MSDSHDLMSRFDTTHLCNNRAALTSEKQSCLLEALVLI